MFFLPQASSWNVSDGIMKLPLGLATVGALIGLIVSAVMPGLATDDTAVLVVYHSLPVIVGFALAEYFRWALSPEE